MKELGAMQEDFLAYDLVTAAAFLSLSPEG